MTSDQPKIEQNWTTASTTRDENETPGIGVVEGEERAREDDRDGVVEDGLAEDHREEVDLDAERLEDGEDGHRVGRRDERAEDEAGQQRHRVAPAQLAKVVHPAADDEGKVRASATRQRVDVQSWISSFASSSSPCSPDSPDDSVPSAPSSRRWRRPHLKWNGLRPPRSCASAARTGPDSVGM